MTFAIATYTQAPTKQQTPTDPRQKAFTTKDPPAPHKQKGRTENDLDEVETSNLNRLVQHAGANGADELLVDFALETDDLEAHGGGGLDSGTVPEVAKKLRDKPESSHINIFRKSAT